ncbi:SURF1 family protein [Rickettsiella grylli]|nr:SURF1 family protein [Rickettsiella grylli]
MMKKNSIVIPFTPYYFTFTFVPTCMLFFLFSLLMYLGFWQIDRGNRKHHLQKIFNQRSSSRPIHLNQIKNIDLKKNYFRGIVQGHFDNPHTFLLENRIYLHKIGYEVLTPFFLNNQSNAILVNRGWIPQGMNRKQIPKISAVDHQIKLEGVIVFPPKTFHFFNPINEEGWPKKIQSIHPDFLKKNKFQPFLLVVQPQQPGSFIPLWHPITLQPARHYAYAFQWFGLSITLFIVFLSAHIHRL